MLASKVVFEGQGVNEKIYGLGEHRTGRVNQYISTHLIIKATPQNCWKPLRSTN